MNTGFFKSHEGEELFFYEWNYKAGQKTLIVIHRGHEYGERLQEFATHPLFASYNIFAFDMRGHGHTKAAVSPAFMDSVRDLDTFAKFLGQRYGVREEDIFVVANSIGGVIVSAWVHDFAPRIAGMALLAPAFEINLIVPLAKQAIELMLKINPKLIVKSYVKSKMLTRDPEQQRAYDTDRFITRSINGKLLIDLANAGKRLVEDAAAYVGWVYFIMFLPLLAGVLLTVSGIYISHFLAEFIDFEPNFLHYSLIGWCNGVIFLFLNIFRPKSSGVFLQLTAVLKLFPLIFIAAFGIISLLGNDTEPLNQIENQAIISSNETNFWLLVGASFIPIAFSMDGWYIAMQISGEIKDSQKNLPKGRLSCRSNLSP